MNNRFLLVILAALFIFSCDHFVNLGDKSASDDYTEGLPDEMSEDRSDTGSDANYDDWNEDSADSGAYEDNNTDTAPEGEDWGNTGWDSGDSDTTDTVDTADTADSADCTDSGYPDPGDTLPDSGSHFPEGNPFPEEFSNADCDCGDELDYEPICCNGVISVFNLCFAHCYAINSGNKICTAYKAGLCIEHDEPEDEDETENDDDEDADDNDQDIEIIDDNDAELPDSDEDAKIVNNECGCYPEEKVEIFSCEGNSYFITSCLANCHCDDPQKLFF